MREDEIKAGWRESDGTGSQVSLSQVRESAARFHRRVRSGDLIEYIACGIVLVGCAFYIWMFPSLRMKLASVVMMVATGFVVYQLRRHGAARLPPADAAAVSVLAFHRREILRRRELLRNSWLLFVAPLLAGMLVFLACLAPDRPYARLPLVAFAGGIVAMGVAISLYNIWQAGRLRKQLEELDALYGGPT